MGDSKHSDTMSDQGNIPYDVLLQDLTQAKRQLLELHNLECATLEGSKNGLQSRLSEEELAVAKDAIGNLRSTFGGSDPNQHILDTLEQCISVIIEKLHRLDQDKNGSRLGSMDLDKSIEGPTGPPTTKILYFTNRSVTPFMSSINKKIGEITLRDFKVLFDRPGFYRF